MLLWVLFPFEEPRSGFQGGVVTANTLSELCMRPRWCWHAGAEQGPSEWLQHTAACAVGTQTAAHVCCDCVHKSVICSYCYGKRQTSAILQDTHTLWHQQRAQAVSEAVRFIAAADIPSRCASFSCSVTSLASLSLTYISFFPCSSDLDITYRKAEFSSAATREYILK